MAPFSHKATMAYCHALPLQLDLPSRCDLGLLYFHLLLLLHCLWFSRLCPSLPVPLILGLCLKVTVSGSPPPPSPHTDMLTSLPSFPAGSPPLHTVH